MKYRIWYSTESFADYIIAKTKLHSKSCEKKKLYESDANNPKNFHSLPDHIKKILYLDAPDIIVELDTEPIFSIEISTEAGTGHNCFQRFARLAASVENNVPAFYIYPEAAIITRRGSYAKWDKINPLIFNALDCIMDIYNIPALLYYFPSDFNKYPVAGNSPHLRRKGLRFEPGHKYAGSPDSRDSEMIDMFNCIDKYIETIERHGVIEGRKKLISKNIVRTRRRKMYDKSCRTGDTLSPLTATEIIPTKYLLKYLSQYEDSSYTIGELLRNRPETLIYKIDATFRGDPYPGALAAIDYLKCRDGRSFEERIYNLVIAWGELSINHKKKTIKLDSTKSTIKDFIENVKSSEGKNLLTKDFIELTKKEIPRYYMQVRYGSMFSKVKHIRVFSYFADAILFPDGALWRDG